MSICGSIRLSLDKQKIVDAVILCSKSCSDCVIHQRAGQPSFAAAGGACDDAVLAISDPIATGQTLNQSAIQIAVRRVQSIFNTCVWMKHADFLIRVATFLVCLRAASLTRHSYKNSTGSKL